MTAAATTFHEWHVPSAVPLAHQLVIRFFHDVWNRADEAVAREILHRELVFRPSRGPSLLGRDRFIEYLHSIHAVLDGCVITLDDVIATAGRVAVEMTVTGVHRGNFLGIPGTGRRITWPSTSFFATEGGRIKDIRVLGDIDALKKQLRRSERTSTEHLTRIAIRTSKRITLVDVGNIDWIAAAENYVQIHVGSTAHLLHTTISALEKSLDPAEFVRVHRSTIVHITRIRELRAAAHGEYEITLSGGARVRSSRTYRDAVKSLVRNPFDDRMFRRRAETE